MDDEKKEIVDKYRSRCEEILAKEGREINESNILTCALTLHNEYLNEVEKIVRRYADKIKGGG